MMPRYQMDDSLYDDPAVIRAGTAAFGLYARCGDYVARQLLDGYVPAEVAAQWGTPEWTRKLLDAGLWETVPGGFHMPRYLNEDKNPSREQVLADRERKAQRQKRWLEKHRSASTGQRRVSRPSTRQSNGPSADGQKDDALPPSLTGRKGPRAANGAAAAPGPLHARPLGEALQAAGVPPGWQPSAPETVATYADQARKALTTRRPE
jgi:hypothetical protein